MQAIFFEIGFIVVLATALGAVSRRFKQPLFLAYILTGIIVKVLSLSLLPSQETLSLLSELGIAFLLFIVGLELNPQEVKEMGKTALIIGGAQVMGIFLFGLGLGQLINLPVSDSIYLGLALSFSSTIIAVKLLSEKGELTALYGRISVGILLFQDIIAIVVLIFVSGFTNGSSSILTLLFTIAKAALFLAIVWLLSKDFLPAFFKRISTDAELLFVGSIAWCLVLAGIAKIAGFSLEIGAFLAGLSLATTSYRFQIGGKIKPLRDFFILIFFVLLGLEASFSSFFSLLIPTLVCVAGVLVLKPLIVILTMSFLGYRKRPSFLTGLYLSQISEFSLVLAALGVGVGQIQPQTSTLITLSAIATIAASSYAISRDQQLYRKLKDLLARIEHIKRIPASEDRGLDYVDHVVLIGCHRMGVDFWHALKQNNIPYVVLDFDPKIIKSLQEENVACVFGDMGDPEVLETLNLRKAKMVISTVPNFTDNMELLELVRKDNPKIITILTASQTTEALRLYQYGANYVILPHLLGGHAVADLLNKHWENMDTFGESKERHVRELLQRRDFTQESS